MLISRTMTYHVQPGPVEVTFVVTLTGADLLTAMVELCGQTDDVIVYHDRWPVRRWFSSPEPMSETDSTVIAIVDSLLGRTLGRFSGDWLVPWFPWFPEFETNPYAPAAQDLKERQYRDAHHLSRNTPLPIGVSDSLLEAPIDSVYVRDLLRRLAVDGASTLSYWRGDESIIEIVWWPEGRCFLRVMRSGG